MARSDDTAKVPIAESGRVEEYSISPCPPTEVATRRTAGVSQLVGLTSRLTPAVRRRSAELIETRIHGDQLLLIGEFVGRQLLQNRNNIVRCTVLTGRMNDIIFVRRKR